MALRGKGWARGVALILAALATLAALPAAARELPAFFKGTRPLGMGGAFTAVADDANALFYNPAGLDRIEQWRVEVINPQLEVGEGGFDFARDAMDTDFSDAGDVTRLIRDYVGESEHYRASLLPNYVRRHFGVGVLAQFETNFQPNNIAFPEMDIEALQTFSAHLGCGFGFFDGVLRVGAAGKYVHRYRLDQVYTAVEIAADDFDQRVKDDLQDDGGFGFDAGLMLAPPWVLEPILAVVVQNIGDTDLGAAGDLPQQINLGLSFQHAFDWLTLVAAADWVDVTNDVGDDDDTYKRLHFGLEGQFARYLSLRGGLYQGYTSLGATLDFRLVRLDYATYAEELGSAAGDKDDRRHVFQLTLGW